jgi:trimethylamine--corrinoid protein Co-methyltransferase
MARPGFTYLSPEEIARVHEAALEVMRDPGIRVMTEEGRRLLVEAGATLSDGDLVSFPGDLVTRALATAPKRFPIHDRTGAVRLRLGDGRCFSGAGVTSLYYLDPRTDERREYTLDDIATSALVTDALSQIDLSSTPGVVKASEDMRVELANQHEFLRMVTNTTKPIMVLVADGPSLEDIFEMAAVVSGGVDAFRERPFVFPYLNTVSPLLLNPETCDKLLIAADWGVPVVCQAAPQTGATAPITVAGSVVLSAAESLAGLVHAHGQCLGWRPRGVRLPVGDGRSVSLLGDPDGGYRRRWLRREDRR